MALLGAKEGLAHICLAMLDAGDLALVPDPGYPVYAGGSILAGAEVRYLRLRPEKGFLPDLDEISEEDARRAKVLFIGYPNNPTAAVIEDDFFERVVAFAKKLRHRGGPRQRLFGTHLRRLRGPKLPGRAGRQGRGRGVLQLLQAVQHDRLAHRLRRRQPRDPRRTCGGSRPTWTRACSTPCNARPPSSSNGPWDFVGEMCEVYRRRRDLLAEALISVGMQVPKHQGDHLHVDPGARGLHFGAASASTCSSRPAWWSRPGRGYGPAGEGFVRLSLTTPDDRIAEAVERIERSLRL